MTDTIINEIIEKINGIRSGKTKTGKSMGNVIVKNGTRFQKIRETLTLNSGRTLTLNSVQACAFLTTLTTNC